MKKETSNEVKQEIPLKFEDLTTIYVNLLRMLAVLPMENRNYDYFLTRCLNIFFFTSGFTHIAMFVIYAYNLIVQFSGMVGLDYVCEFIMVIGYVIRYYIVSQTRGQFLEMQLNTESLWKSCTAQEHYTVQYFVKKIRMLLKCNAVVSIMLTTLYLLSALTIRLPPLQPNGTEARLTPFRMTTLDSQDYIFKSCWIVLETILYEKQNFLCIFGKFYCRIWRMYVNGAEPSPTYWIIFVAQSFILPIALTIGLGIDTAAPFIIMFECGFLRILQERFLSINEKSVRSKDRDDDEYKKIVEYSKFHQNILRLCKKIKKFAEVLFLVQVLSSGYNLSLSGIKLIGHDLDRYKFIPIFGICLIQLFIVQWTPDFLLEESEAVATAAYFAFLSTMHPRTSKLLLIIIQRARRSEQIIAGGIVKMSIESFGKMMTSAVSFFTMLRTFEQS